VTHRYGPVTAVWPLASAAALVLLVSVGLGVAAIAAVGRRSRADAF
jgi:ABC-type spermidine/putrescine transport system permease subunit I